MRLHHCETHAVLMMLNVGAQDHLFFLVVCIAFRGNNAGSADAHTHTS